MSESKIYTIPDNNHSIDPSLMLALTQNGGFGNGNWIWMMFMWMMFPWMFGGNGFGGFGGFGGNNGTGFLANLLNNDAGRDLLLQAINGRADALNQLANMLNTSVSQVQNGINAILNAVQTVGSLIGMTGQLVINSVQAGNATLSQQLCQCCCENRLAIANQTNAILAQAAANHSASTLQNAQNFAASQLLQAQDLAATQLLMSQNQSDNQFLMSLNQAATQLLMALNQAATQLLMAQIESADQLAVCQLTNQLGSQADRNTNNILNAIAGLNTLITKEFCDLKERELQNKIDTQGDIITLLRNQVSNDKLTEAFNAAFNALNDKINGIASRQPNTVPVLWPNIVAANATPYLGGVYGYGQTNFWN